MSDATLDVGHPPASDPAARRGIRGPREFAAGLTLLGIALFVFIVGSRLDMGELRAVGPGFMPRVVAVMIAAFGVGIAISGVVSDGHALERWRWRGPVFVCIAILAFAATIRTVGLALAGPLVVIIGGYASHEAKFRDLVIFAVVITLACIGLFRFALGLAIPILTVAGYTV